MLITTGTIYTSTTFYFFQNNYIIRAGKDNVTMTTMLASFDNNGGVC